MLNENNKTFNKMNYIALGSFDGLHRGHLSLVKKTVSLAIENNGKSIVYTFRNHPRSLLKSGNTFKLLLDNSSKSEILHEENVDLVFFEEFNENFMKLSPEEFIEYLCDKFDVRGIVVGFNYKFGYKNVGNVELLKTFSNKYNYEVYVVETCTYLEEVVSSTRIRENLLKGDIELANEMLTRPYFIKGKVVHGKQLGRKLGFPTANVKYEENIVLPEQGVYYTNIIWNNNIYKSITSIGNNPTVEGSEITLESFMLDFDKDIYNDEIKVNFIKRFRDNVKFNSLDELIIQLNKDKLMAEKEKFM
ncbi:bifunctional riboflavin kinase/FAD synthetase [Clostridium vincentii]|uniref:Riboflavin biosynthesis protein n=1 Tax=Clostridium vincentii TaxID=52704 RepID=A0A2T0BFC1_9CLOT|nr:bifunctional riboflavin kinase/FAD synthetase [Clostridium vincentii]PRR82579.1 Riboflavin biosynthesis protein RibF [Clostridium vincentii]